MFDHFCMHCKIYVYDYHKKSVISSLLWTPLVLNKMVFLGKPRDAKKKREIQFEEKNWIIYIYGNLRLNGEVRHNGVCVFFKRIVAKRLVMLKIIFISTGVTMSMVIIIDKFICWWTVSCFRNFFHNFLRFLMQINGIIYIIKARFHYLELKCE